MQNPLRYTAQNLRKTTLQEGPVSNTLQLCTSKHLGDYQWLVFAVAVVMLIGAILFGMSLCGVDLHDLFADKRPGLGAPKPTEGGPSALATIGLALIPAAVTMFNWLYQAANRRLGVVDL